MLHSWIFMLYCLNALADPPVLGLPIRCTIGQDCFIQNYVDSDTGPGWRDYTCGYLSYDGHAGTDFRLPGMVAMRQGVAVLAAADGIVTGLRDGEPDVPVLIRAGDPESGKRAAGNGVRIDHGDGWETQYSHMLKGSINVRMGQKIHTGDQLGLVGLSGNTEFPHVDLTVRQHGQAVDPFAPSGGKECATGTDTLWKPEILNALRYTPTGLLLSGWADAAPDRAKAQNGEYPEPGINAGALVFWVELFGVQRDDKQTFELFDPQGQRMLSSTTVIPGNKAAWFGYAGKPRPPQGWTKGSYRAEYRLERKGATLITATQILTLR